MAKPRNRSTEATLPTLERTRGGSTQAPGLADGDGLEPVDADELALADPDGGDGPPPP